MMCPYLLISINELLISIIPFIDINKYGLNVIRKYSFSQRTINVWNKLSTDCVHATSVNVFKNRIDKYLVKAGYT